MKILAEIKPENLNIKGRPIDLEKAVLMSLWTLANQESFRGVSDRFGIGKGHSHRIFFQFCTEISNLVSKYIKWPTGESALRSKSNFENLNGPNGFPAVIGCIDCTHKHPRSKNW